MSKNNVDYLRGIKQGDNILNVTAPFYELKDNLTITVVDYFHDFECKSFLVKPISDCNLLVASRFFYRAANEYDYYGYTVPFSMSISSPKLNLLRGTYPITATLYTTGTYGDIDEVPTDYFKNFELKSLELRIGDLSGTLLQKPPFTSMSVKHSAVGETYCYHNYGANDGYVLQLFGMIGGNLINIDPPPPYVL